MSKTDKLPPPPVEWTMEQASKRWGVSRSRINKWRRQGRVAWRYDERYPSRVLILQSKKPAPVEQGSLARLKRSEAWLEYRAAAKAYDKATG